MMTPTESLNYDERVVAFIDVLGFAELVKASDGDRSARIKIEKLMATDELFRGFTSTYLSRLSGQAAFFSDSFVLSMSMDRIFYLIREVGYLCRHLLLLGLPCRGAITAGLLHHRERMVVGPSLVKAYKLEQSVAIYPRIILDEASVALWKNEFDPTPAHLHCELLVKRDRDGQHFIDIFHPAWPEFFPWTEFIESTNSVPTDPAEFLKAASAQIKDGIEAFRSNPKVYAKYAWLESEYNEHKF